MTSLRLHQAAARKDIYGLTRTYNIGRLLDLATASRAVVLSCIVTFFLMTSLMVNRGLVDRDSDNHNSTVPSPASVCMVLYINEHILESTHSVWFCLITPSLTT